jgi:hypothetical protein
MVEKKWEKNKREGKHNFRFKRDFPTMSLKRAHEGDEEEYAPPGSVVKVAKTSVDLQTPAVRSSSSSSSSSASILSLSSFPPGLVFCGFGGGRRQRGLKAAATREMNAMVAQAWAAGAADRPFQNADLADVEKFDGAFDYFKALSLPVSAAAHSLMKPL